MFVIRHGQSAFNLEFNRTGRDPGIRDAPLTPRGVMQAEGAAHLLKDKGLTRIISSPYTRALQTAKAVSRELGLGITAEPLLGERALYTCDIGTPTAALRASWPDIDFSRVEQDVWWPKNESQEDIERRVAAFLALWDAPEMKTTLLVSHWYFIFTLSGGLDAENAEILHRDTQGRFHKQTY